MISEPLFHKTEARLLVAIDAIYDDARQDGVVAETASSFALTMVMSLAAGLFSGLCAVEGRAPSKDGFAALATAVADHAFHHASLPTSEKVQH